MSLPGKILGWLVPSWFWPAVLAAAVLAAFGWHKWQVAAAYSDGREAERAAAIVLAGKRLKDMEKNNAAFRSMSARDKCAELLRSSRLPVGNNCD